MERLRRGEKLICELSCGVEIREGLGYNLITEVPGASEEEVHLVVHHDHWFTGFCDNVLGLALLLTLPRVVSKWCLERTLHLITFTAEEGCARGVPGWYWLHGSRTYCQRHGEELVERCLLVLCHDAFMKYPLEIYTTPEVRTLLEEITTAQVQFREPSVYFDSLNYHLTGIPGATFSSLDVLTPYYHSTEDTVERISVQDLETYLQYLLKVLHLLLVERRELDYTRTVVVVQERLRRLGLEVSCRGTRSEVTKLYRILLKPYYYGVFGKDFDRLYVDLVPEVKVVQLLELTELAEYSGEYRILSEVREELTLLPMNRKVYSTPLPTLVRKLVETSHHEYVRRYVTVLRKYLAEVWRRVQEEVQRELEEEGFRVKIIRRPST